MRLGGGTVQNTAASSSPRHSLSHHNIHQIEEDEDTKAVMPGDATSALSAPWEHLLSSTISPAAAVAVKMAISEDEPEDQQQPSSSSRRRVGSATENGGLLGTIHRHLPALSRLSLGAAAAAAKTKGDQGAPLFRYRQARFSSRRVRKRVVFKNGDCNVIQGNVAKRRRRYLQDIFTTLVDAQWRWTLLVFALNFLLSWLGFAIIWWLIVYSHGDLSPESNPRVAAALAASTANSNATMSSPGRTVSEEKEWTPCVKDISGFASCFLFSVETQHTIGYGSRHTTEECPEAIFVMCLQSIVGVMIQAFMVGIVFAKLSRPKKRTQTLLFSRNAVICQRDGYLCLMFRVGDMRKSHIVEAHVRAQLIKRKVTQEGELLPYYQHELTVGGDGEEDKIFFIWPTTIVHKIDPSSPLYVLSAAEMIRERFEIVVILEGVIESTGMTTQARSSYLPSEVLWGHRFEPLVSFKKDTGEYEVDYSLFNNTYEVDTPLCSAKALDDLKIAQQQQQRHRNNEHQQRLERLMSPTMYPALHAPPSDTLDLGSTDSNSASIEEPSVVTVTSPIDVPGPESTI
ncbi:G protein-activated inward rectifier potassium channel 3 [Cryptotermes secundus]|nr:G protein-activated inward rectifier potassium channel 3 [Cryptotermes secundus]XP_033609541.1 G protein-activated inward rectifier potassium channel 3 [Cryptotermes secundus]XP_033609542.1 G protein-activated inward rectifier potassium channel 3 [Cryptotermes secundus]